MKQIRKKRVLFSVLALLVIYSCSKRDELYEGGGGMLPTNYIIINDSSFTPSLLTVATGSSITFVNDSDLEHSVVSDDSAAILSGTITARTSFFYKKDTTGIIPYHCGKHPSEKAVIIIRP